MSAYVDTRESLAPVRTLSSSVPPLSPGVIRLECVRFVGVSSFFLSIAELSFHCVGSKVAPGFLPCGMYALPLGGAGTSGCRGMLGY